ncbi:ribonuclease D [Vibrio sp. 10N.286.49.B3]|uniref:ribonuclease D n=1 Tax=Vibrio sp. 10N.286.49.B3 TaxID=1880855 RepID=UPI000C85ACCB|nr:ribonuclease D [Vibrio sp. 10N.286.49.B3]PMH41891.1 ribonuclease D [Vibrio sp. 10N.286.49.B3]
MNYQIITQIEDLERVCLQAREADVVMLDTEFVRTRTFYPLLGLIQLFDGENLSLIDPVALEDKMEAFVGLLQDPSTLKVLHACGEDLEVFQNSFGCTPAPMIDTQVMAAFLGNGLSTGFATLVNEFVGVELDKSESRTDWMARPLTKKQLDYAAADVFYLLPLYEKLLVQVKEANWWEAAQQECELLVRKRIKHINKDKLYTDIKGAWQLTPAQLAVLKPLAKWRYEEAMRRDLALNFIFKEQDLWSVARFGLKSLRNMEQHGIDVRSARRHSARIGAIVTKAEQTASDDYPEEIVRLMDFPTYKQLFKRLKDEVKLVSDSTGLAVEFLASKKQMNQLLSWIWKKNRNPEICPDVMQGWRLEILGQRLDKLI